MRELVLHVPVHVGGHDIMFFCSHRPTMPQLLRPTRQWLLQPVPHGIRIAGLALCGRHSAACPALAMPRDLLLMPASQLQNIRRLDLWDAPCPDFPPMPRLTHLTVTCEPDPAHAMLPLRSLTMLQGLEIHGIGSCPSLSSLSRLTRLVLGSHPLPAEGAPAGPAVPPVYQASADLPQVLKVCHASSILLPPTSALACQILSHMLQGPSSSKISGPELGLP